MEDVRDAQKKLTQVESDLELAKRKLEEANKDLEEKEKALSQVCLICKSSKISRNSQHDILYFYIRLKVK